MSPTEPATAETLPHGEVRHEARDASIRGVFLTAAGLAITVIVVALVSRVVFENLQARLQRAQPPPLPLAAEAHGQLPAPPRLEGLDPNEVLRNLHGVSRDYAAAERELQALGWVDRQAGVVRLPIEQAMKLMVEEQLVPSHSAETARQQPSSSNSGRGREGDSR